MKFTAIIKDANRITIDKRVVDALKLKEGDYVEIDIKKIKKISG